MQLRLFVIVDIIQQHSRIFGGFCSMANDLNITEDIKSSESRIRFKEEVLGKGLMMPFNPANSGSRKIMFGVHREHAMPLFAPEVPVIGTGYENQFGYYSSSFIEADKDYKVLTKIPKFSKYPDYHYWMITVDEKKQLNVVERISYKHITETHGYQFNNSYLDDLKPGSSVKKGEVIKKSTSFDDYNNRMDGVNLLTAYLSCDTTMEDGIILSESAARKFDSPLYKKVSIIVNDNDILLNLYGSGDSYKTFPDIGEYIQDGLVCATRRENKAEQLFTQSYNRLKDIMMSDDKYTIESGQVIDINVYCNNPEKLQTSLYNSQLRGYYDDSIRLHTDMVSFITPLLEQGYTMSYDLQKIYYTAKDILSGKKYMKDRAFSNIIMELIVLERNEVKVGDKFSDRHGGKGVVAEIRPDHLMPQIEKTNEYIEMINNLSTVVNRVNVGQLLETSITSQMRALIDHILDNNLDDEEGFGLIYNFISNYNLEQADYMNQSLNFRDEENVASFVKSICSDRRIMLSLKPITNNASLDTLREVYDNSPWTTQCYITVPIKDSNGNIRYIQSRRPIVCGTKYEYRLKQYAEEKFSATSLSATNIRNENSRSKANKLYKWLFTKTPIKFGDMETGDLAHLGMETVIINLMLHSTSPHGRRLAEDLLTGNPFDINIKLDENSTNRSVEILNAYFKTMGLRLVFERRYKEVEHPILINPIRLYKPSMVEPIRLYSEAQMDQYHDPLYLEKLESVMKPDGLIRPIMIHPIRLYSKK